MVELTQEEFNAIFREFPSIRKAESGAPICPYCDNALSPESLELWNGSTEYGTPFCNVEIDCDVCDQRIWSGGSWHGDAYSKEDQVQAIGDALYQQDYAGHELAFEKVDWS